MLLKVGLAMLVVTHGCCRLVEDDDVGDRGSK